MNKTETNNEAGIMVPNLTAPMPRSSAPGEEGRSLSFGLKGFPNGEYFIHYDLTVWNSGRGAYIYRVMLDEGEGSALWVWSATADQLEKAILRDGKTQTQKQATRKQIVEFCQGENEMCLKPGGRDRMVLTCDGVPTGEVVVSGQVRLADGSEYYALLIIDEHSSGEHFGTGVIYSHGEGKVGCAWQDDGPEEFAAALKKDPSEVFPYTYRYAKGTVHCEDHHVDPKTGWSR